MMNSNLLWFCKKCLKKELPFNSITNQEFNKIYDSKYATAFQKVTPDFKEKAAHLAKEQTNNILNCSYYDLSDLNKINIKDNKYFSLFHLYISSLPYHFEEIEELLDQMKIKPEIIGISESRIYKDKEPLTNICLKRHFVTQHPTSRQTSHNPHPTSRTSHIPNIPHPQHLTSRASHIPNIPHPQHPTSPTSHIPNIPHPQHPTSPTSHIPNIPLLEHPTSPTSHFPNIPRPQHPTS